MPVAPTYPGVYIEEVPSGVRTITGVATSITAFIGRTPRGPVNSATEITSFGDFERTFGGLAASYPLTYAVRDFYQNGGSTAVIVRLFKFDNGTGVADVTVGELKLAASSPGSWGAKLRADVEVVDDAEAKASMGLAPDDALFNLRVRDTRPGGAVERILNLVVPKDKKKDVVRRPDKVLARESNLVRWKGDWPAAENDRPEAANVKNGASDTASADEKAAEDAAKAYTDAKNALVANPAKAAGYQKAQGDLQVAHLDQG